MSATHQGARKHLEAITGTLTAAEIARRLEAKHHKPKPRVPGASLVLLQLPQIDALH